MIKDKITNMHYYESETYLGLIADFLKEFKIQNLQKNMLYKLNDKISYFVTKYYTHDLIKKNFEIHHEHIDVQVVISGREKVYINSNKSNSLLEYNIKKDTSIYYSKSNFYVSIEKDDFLVILPHEYHQPNVKDKKIDLVEKIVFKIRK